MFSKLVFKHLKTNLWLPDFIRLSMLREATKSTCVILEISVTIYNISDRPCPKPQEIAWKYCDIHVFVSKTTKPTVDVTNVPVRLLFFGQTEVYSIFSR